MEFRAVELCEQIASDKVIELAIKYAGRIHRMALADKLEAIAEKKDRQAENQAQKEEEVIEFESHNDEIDVVDTQDDLILTPIAKTTSDIEIRPLTLSGKRNNPFVKRTESPSSKGNGNFTVCFKSDRLR